MTTLLTAAETLADDIGLLKAISDVVASWKDLETQPGITTLEALLDEIAAGVSSSAVADAFKTVGLDETYATLSRSLKSLTDATKKIAPKYKALLNPISTFAIGDVAANVSWTASAGNGKPVLSSKDYSLNLGASATLLFDAADKFPGQNPPEKLLSVGASGSLSASGTATLPYAFGSVTAGAGASASVGLTYYFDADDKELYALAVARRLGSFADPFALDDLWQRMSTTSLAGVVYTFNGAGNVQVQVSVADGIQLGGGLKANIGATVGVSANLKSTYTLSLRKQVDSNKKFCSISTKLARDPLSTVDVSGSLGLTVDVSSLTKPVLEALNTAIKDWDSVLNRVKPFLNPGTWLRTEATALLSNGIASLVSDARLRTALITDLKGAFGAQDVTTSALVGWLQDQVTGAIDRASAMADDGIEAATKRAMANLGVALPAFTDLAEGKLVALVENLVGELNKKLLAAVQDIFQTAGIGPAVTDALEQAGVRVGSVVNTADAALKPIRDLIESVDTQFHKYLSTAEEALKRNVAAKIYFDDSTTTGTAVEIDGTFTALDDDSRTVFDALFLGKLQTLVSLVAGQFKASSFTLGSGSSITRFNESRNETGLEIAFLNFDLKISEVVTGKAKCTLDGFGNVHVDTSGSLTDDLLGTHDVSFVDAYALAVAGVMGAHPVAGSPVLQLGLSATYTDNSLRWTDIKDFMSGLDASALINPGALDRAQKTFDAWSKTTGTNGKVGGSISAALRLTGNQIVALLALNNRTATGDLSPAARKAVVQAGLDALFNANAKNPRFRSEFDDGRNSAAGLFLFNKLTTDADVVLNYQNEVFKGYRLDDKTPPTGTNAPPLFSGGTQDNYVQFLKTTFALLRLVDLVDTMGMIYRSIPASPAGGLGGWNVERYKADQLKLMNCSKYWVTVFNTVFSSIFDSTITPQTIAFMRAMANLAGLGTKPGGVVITMTFNTKSGPQTVALG